MKVTIHTLVLCLKMLALFDAEDARMWSDPRAALNELSTKVENSAAPSGKDVSRHTSAGAGRARNEIRQQLDQLKASAGTLTDDQLRGRLQGIAEFYRKLVEMP